MSHHLTGLHPKLSLDQMQQHRLPNSQHSLVVIIKALSFSPLHKLTTLLPCSVISRYDLLNSSLSKSSVCLYEHWRVCDSQVSELMSKERMSLGNELIRCITLLYVWRWIFLLVDLEVTFLVITCY